MQLCLYRHPYTNSVLLFLMRKHVNSGNRKMPQFRATIHPVSTRSGTGLSSPSPPPHIRLHMELDGKRQPKTLFRVHPHTWKQSHQFNTTLFQTTLKFCILFPFWQAALKPPHRTHPSQQQGGQRTSLRAPKATVKSKTLQAISYLKTPLRLTCLGSQYFHAFSAPCYSPAQSSGASTPQAS